MDNYYNTNEFKEILAKYEGLPEDESNLTILGADDYSEIAQYYHERGNDEEALKAVHTALDVYPGSVAPLSFLSRYALLEEQNIDKAENIADEIADKHDPDYFLLIAEIMIVDGRADEADSYLESARQEFYDDDYYDDMPLDVAVLFTDYEEMDLAEKWLELSDENDEDDYIEVKAKILISKGQLVESEDLLNKLINKDPYSTTYWNLLAAAQLMDGNTNDAITSNDFALAINPDDRDALIGKANGLMLLNNYPAAEKLLRHYIKLEPHKDSGYMMVGLTLIGQERIQEALEFFGKALKANKKTTNSPWQTRVDILYQMAYLENYLEHFHKANEYLDMIADIYKDNLSYDMDALGNRLSEVDCAKGHICLEEEKLDEALEWFDQAVTDSNHNPKTYVKIAVSSYESGYVQYAYNILHELIYEEGVENTLGMTYLAMCCKRLGKSDEQQWAEKRIGKNKQSQEK